MDTNGVKDSLMELILDENSVHSNKEYLDMVNKYQLLLIKYNNAIKTSSDIFNKMHRQMESLKRQGIYTKHPTYECRRCDNTTTASKSSQNHQDARLLQLDANSDD